MTVKELKEILRKIPDEDIEMQIKTSDYLPSTILCVNVECSYYSPTEKRYFAQIYIEE
jgi:hypothetical protein